MLAQLLFSGLALGSMYSLVALGYNITYATSRTVNFSQGQSVMAGAVLVGLVAYRIAGRRAAAVLGGPMRLPAVEGIDRRLVLGSLVFGIGWGLAGFCPGPALVALGAGYGKAAAFVGAMIAGMALYELLQRGRTPAAAGMKDEG